MLVLWVTMVGEAGALIGSGQKGLLSSCQVVLPGQVVNKSTLAQLLKRLRHSYSPPNCIDLSQQWISLEKNNLISGFIDLPQGVSLLLLQRYQTSFRLVAKMVGHFWFAFNTNCLHRTGHIFFSVVGNSFFLCKEHQLVQNKFVWTQRGETYLFRFDRSSLRYGALL